MTGRPVRNAVPLVNDPWEKHEVQAASAIITAALRHGPMTADELIRSVAGIYPAVLFAALSALIQAGNVRVSGDRFVASGDEMAIPRGQMGPPRLGTADGLPIPHPLDFDWRYAPETVASLSTYILGSTTQRHKVLLLGAPTIFSAMHSVPTAPSLTLIDQNQTMIRHLGRVSEEPRHSLMCADLLRGRVETGSLFEICLLDPPWYPEHYEAFLKQAATSLLPEGRALVSLLPMNTRPNAAVNRHAVVTHAERLGLHLEALRPAALEYSTPIFETNSLLAMKVAAPAIWRSGDLATFVKLPEASTANEPDSSTIADNTIECWYTAVIGAHKAMLRGPFDDPAVPSRIYEIEANNILPTVSRRYAGRQMVGLWLWDNRVYGVAGRCALRAALALMTQESDPELVEDVPDRLIARAMSQLEPILFGKNPSSAG